MWRELHGHNFPALSEKDEILAAKLRDICNSADNRQVAFVATTAGFGNQLYGALSTVLYGAVTGRRIRLHWGRFVDLQPFLQPHQRSKSEDLRTELASVKHETIEAR